jgi:hypothetical protein
MDLGAWAVGLGSGVVGWVLGIAGLQVTWWVMAEVGWLLGFVLQLAVVLVVLLIVIWLVGVGCRWLDRTDDEAEEG